MRNEKTKAAGSSPDTKGSLNLPDHETSVTDADSGLTPADVCQNGADAAQAGESVSGLHQGARQGDLTPHSPTCRDCRHFESGGATGARGLCHKGGGPDDFRKRDTRACELFEPKPARGEGSGVGRPRWCFDCRHWVHEANEDGICNNDAGRYAAPSYDTVICDAFEAKPEQGEGSDQADEGLRCGNCVAFGTDSWPWGHCARGWGPTSVVAFTCKGKSFQRAPDMGEGSGVAGCEGCAYLCDPRPDRCMLCRRGPHGHPFQLDGYDSKDGPAGCTELDDSPKSLELIIDWASRHWFGSQYDAGRFARDLRAWLEPRACPFCAANDAHPEETTDNSRTTYVVCESCGAQGPPFDSEWTALLAWNKRGTR